MVIRSLARIHCDSQTAKQRQARRSDQTKISLFLTMLKEILTKCLKKDDDMYPDACCTDLNDVRESSTTKEENDQRILKWLNESIDQEHLESNEESKGSDKICNEYSDF